MTTLEEQKRDILRQKLDSILSCSNTQSIGLESNETLQALQYLETFYHPEMKKQKSLQILIGQEKIKLNQRIYKVFNGLQNELNNIEGQISGLNNLCESMEQKLADTESRARRIFKILQTGS